MSNKQESHWIHCPVCRGRTRTKVYDNTVLINYPLFCPKCKNETCIDVIQLQLTISKALDA